MTAETAASDERTPLAVGVGEALVRFTARDRLPLEYANQLDIDVGGAELNALVAMSQLGCRCRFVSRLPSTALGRIVRAHALRHQVDTEIDWDEGGRVGLYFVEQGVPPRPTRVFYDRKASSAAGMRPGMFKWSQLLQGAAVLHSTGITCALGREVEEMLIEALEAAREIGVARHFDVNYRGQLWSREDAAASLRRVLPLVDVLFASRQDLELVADGEAQDDVDLIDAVREQYGLELVVLRTVREVGVATVEVSVHAHGAGLHASSAARAMVVDAFGAGDVAAAAFTSARLAGVPLERAVERAARASAYMYTIPGDTWVLPEVDLDAAAPAGRIIR